MAFFLFQQVAWNFLQTVQQALVPDIVPAEQIGTAGGMAAANTLVGALGGLLSVWFMRGQNFHGHYAIGMVLTVVCTWFVCLTVQRTPHDLPEMTTKEVADTNSWLQELKNCYKLDVERYPEFAKLMVSKTLYSASVMVKGFLLFFVQDIFKLQSLEREQAIVSNAAVSAEAMAALAACVTMAFLDARRLTCRGGDAKALARSFASSAHTCARSYTMLGAGWMALFWLGPPLVGFGVLQEPESIGVEAIAARWVPRMVIGTALWGIGQGVYVAGDQALAYALLPDQNEASRLLGLTSVSSAVGAVFGGSVAGGLLLLLGSDGEASGLSAPGYGFLGYTAMFAFAMVLGVVCCLVLASMRPETEVNERTHILQ